MTRALPPERAPRARDAWPVRLVALGRRADDDLSTSTTAAQRLAFVEELSRDAWALTGRALPTYDRASMPIRLVPAARPSA